VRINITHGDVHAFGLPSVIYFESRQQKLYVEFIRVLSVEDANRIFTKLGVSTAAGTDHAVLPFDSFTVSRT